MLRWPRRWLRLPERRGAGRRAAAGAGQSPTAPLISATVPAQGARRAVASSASSAFWTASLALSTAAAAAASDMVEVPEPPALELLPPFVLVLLGVVVVEGVVVDAGAAVLDGAVVDDGADEEPFTSAAVAVTDEEAVDAVVVVVVADWTSSSVSCALWRFACASARSTSAAVGSMRASSWPSVTCSPALTYTLVTWPEAREAAGSSCGPATGCRSPKPSTARAPGDRDDALAGRGRRLLGADHDDRGDHAAHGDDAERNVRSGSAADEHGTTGARHQHRGRP